MEGNTAALRCRREDHDARIQGREIQRRQRRQGQGNGLPLAIGHHPEVAVAAGAGEEAIQLHGHARGVGAVVCDLQVKDQGAPAVGGDIDSRGAAEEEHPEGRAVIEGCLDNIAPLRFVGGHDGKVHLIRGIGPVGVVGETAAGIRPDHAPVPHGEIDLVVEHLKIG